MTKIQELIENADNAYYAVEYDRAIELYKQVLALSPKNKHAQQYLQKIEELKRLIENADDAYYVAEYDKAIQLYKQVLELDIDNKYAQEHLRKAERNRLSKNSKPETVPTEALELYMRSRSFIVAGDLTLARKMLRQAIDISEESGVKFTSAQYLLGNIQSVLKAEEFKAKAHNEIDAGQWARAVDDLNSAFNLDPIDDATGTLLSHLRTLLKARNLINNLNAGNGETGSRSTDIREIRKIIKLTSETTELSKLWQEVVNLFGEYNNKNKVFRNIKMVFRWILLVALSASVILLSTFWFLFLHPRNRDVPVDCHLIAPGLNATLNYPAYVANGDEDEIEIIFKNDSHDVINSLVVFAIEGPAKPQLVNPTRTGIKITDLQPTETIKVPIYFSVDEPFNVISNPGNYIDFRICPANINSEDYHIAMSPIYGLRKFIVYLWSTVGLALIGLSWSQIKEWLLSVFKGTSG